MDKQIVYILSTNYAGSHFLGLQLGSHSQCASIGELHHFRRKNSPRKACSSCERDSDCPVYSGVREKPIRQSYETIFSNLASYDSSISTVIDNSKKVRWACRFVNMQGYTKKYIHLIRDPRALVRRWMISFDKSSKKKMRVKTARRCWPHAWDILTGDEANVYLWDWLYENRQISDFIQSNKLDAKIVTYHDLVFKTDEVLSGLMNWLGYEYEPKQKDYWDFIHHSSVKSSYMQPPTNSEKIFDQRWKSFLTEDVQNRVLEHPHIRSFVNRLGLVLDAEKGLLGENNI